MGYFYVNNVTYGGSLDKAASSFTTKSGTTAWWFSLKVQKAHNIFGYVSVMVYSPHLIELVENYMIEANIGKRIVVSGETGFSAGQSQAVMLLLNSVTFADTFIDKAEAERRQDDMPDFSGD